MVGESHPIPMQAEAAKFAFLLCNSHHERALKAEVALARPDWRSSYQRKGFVTFKVEAGVEWGDLQAGISTARRTCLSLGRFASAAEAETALPEVRCLHSVVHEDHALRPVAPQQQVSLVERDLVGTVVSLSETEHWAGLHQHAPGLSPDPGGDGGLTLPSDAPSRAWLKLEEAVRFWGLKFEPGEVALELGSAPGGVVHALLERGVSVIGVDPAGMAQAVMQRAVANLPTSSTERAWFHHCRKPAALLAKRDLATADGGPGWLLSDMNLSPEVVLEECARLLKMAPTIHSALLTLKLTGMEELERKANWIRAMREMGFGTVRLQQLAVHHRELALMGTR